jgi:hypothetical protein
MLRSTRTPGENTDRVVLPDRVVQPLPDRITNRSPQINTFR